MGCLVATPGLKELAKSRKENIVITKAKVSLWATQNNKEIHIDDELPTSTELDSFVSNLSSFSLREEGVNGKIGWAQSSAHQDNLEVSSKGDRTFSALNATFKEGTTIQGVDVSGKTIEDVYQTIIKQSQKNSAPSKDSILYFPQETNNAVLEEISFWEGYFPLWQTWAKQHPKEMLELLRTIKNNGVHYLTDQFAKTRVSQARALAYIVNEIMANPNYFKTEVQTRKRWTRTQVKEETDKVFLFGDNIEDAKTGYVPSSTQAVIRGLPNAIGIPTKKTRGKRGEDYLTDDDFNEAKELIDEAILKAKRSGKIIVIPEDGIGTGAAQLQKRAPKIFNYLQDQLNKLIQGYSNRALQIEEFNDIMDAVQRAERPKITTTYTPQVRRDRAEHIASLFSEFLTEDMEDEIKELEQAIENMDKSDPDYFRIKAYLKMLKGSEGRVFYLLHSENGVNGIFQEILDELKAQSEEDEQALIQEQINAYLSMSDASNYTQEQLQKRAEIFTKHRLEELKKMSDPEIFRTLCEDAAMVLQQTEKIVITFEEGADVQEAVNISEDINGENTDNVDMADREEDKIESWGTKLGKISAWDSLSGNIRTLISTIPRLTINGKIDYDDLGNQRNLSGTYVCTVIMDTLRDIIEPTDMMPVLEKAVTKYKWLQSVVDRLKEDPNLQVSFYSNFRKETTRYWTQAKTENPDGTVTWRTVALNHPEGTYYMLDAWQDNQLTGSILSSMSLYKEDGTINYDNLAKIKEAIDSLSKELSGIKSNKTAEEIAAQLRTNNGTLNEAGQKLKEILESVGITVDMSILYDFIAPSQDVTAKQQLGGARWLLNKVNTIITSLQKSKVQTQDLNLINEFASIYNEIALELSKLDEDVLEDMVYQNGSAYWAHNHPSYFSKVIKNLRNSMNDIERFKAFIQEQYGQYEWFCQDGEWLLDVLQDLTQEGVRGEEARKALQTKVLIDAGKKEYSEWTELDYLLVLLNEFYSEPKSQYAYYAVPVMSDSTNAVFVRLHKYAGNVVTGESIEQVIIDKLFNLVKQEFSRILLVEKRGEAINKGELKAIDAYDITFDSNGKVQNKGGSQFVFLPKLNEKKVGDKSFLNYLKENWHNENDSLEDVTNTIKQVLMETVEEMFEEDYEYFKKVGLLTTLNNGNYKYLPLKSEQGSISSLKNAIDAAAKILGETEEIKKIRRTILNGIEITTREQEQLLNKIKDALTAYGKNNNINVSNIINSLKYTNQKKEYIKEFYYNNLLAVNNIIQLTSTDLAFFGPINNFYKRNKQIWAGGDKLYTEAMYNGKKIGRQFERSIYLSDEMITSSAIQEIKKAVLASLEKGEITDYDAAYTLANLGLSNYQNPKTKTLYFKLGDTLVKTEKINTTDGQSLRTLSSYKSIVAMTEGWTDEQEAAYNAIKEGKFTAENLQVIWSVKKPFKYTQIKVSDGFEGNIKVPVQHKNSEFLLLVYGALAESMGGKTVLSELNRFMEDHDIDVAHFQSVVKVGGQGAININGIGANDLYSYLEEAIQDKDGREDSNIVHIADYADYSIQTKSTEHYFDTNVILGTQLRKLITADMPEDMQINVNGKTMTKKEWLHLYQSLLTENILTCFKEVYNIFLSKEELSKILIKEIRTNPRYSRDLIQAVLLNENGDFNFPLFDPINKTRTEQMLLSIIRNRITKQKIRGGAVAQVSNYGLREDLRIVMDKKTGGIKYMECLLPAYSKQFIEPLMNKDGTLDINKLSDELRTIIGYRIPTEAKYSMAPLYIKGFLPQQNGACIMLPKEITSIAGSDFDFDKLYLILPEFTPTYNKKRARKDFEKTNLIKKFGFFNKKNNLEAIDEEGDAAFEAWWREHKKEYFTGFEKVKYDPSKLPQEQSLAARNNMILDMMFSILTHPSMADRVLKAGGFKNIVKASQIVDLAALGNEALQELLGSKTGKEMAKMLLSLDDNQLSKLTDAASTTKSALSVSSQLFFQHQNMAGANLVGAYANNTVGHALLQHTRAHLMKKHVIHLYGKEVSALNAIKNDRGEYISDNCGAFGAASVDNAKTPCLASLNQTNLTLNVSELLIRLGFSPLQVAAFLRQPIVEHIIKQYESDPQNKFKAKTVIEDAIKEWELRVTKKNPGYHSPSDFTLEEMLTQIIMFEEIEDQRMIGKYEDDDTAMYYHNQVQIGYIFLHAFEAGEMLNTVTQAMRAGTQRGGASATIVGTQMKIDKTQEINSQQLGIEGIEMVIPSDVSSILDNPTLSVDEKINQIRDRLLQFDIPSEAAFYTLGLEAVMPLLRPYFPQASTLFKRIQIAIESFAIRNMTEQEINAMQNELFTYFLSSIAFYGADSTLANSHDKRQQIIFELPKQLKDLKKNNQEIGENQLIKQLKIFTKRRKGALPFDTINFTNAGRLNNILQEQYRRAWADLLYSKDPTAVKLALNLALYCYYQAGFGFSPNSFGHLMPLELRQLLPQYKEKLNELQQICETYEKSEDKEKGNLSEVFTRFITQYIYNNLGRRGLFTVAIPQEDREKFLDKSDPNNTKPRERVTLSEGSDINERTKPYFVKSIIRMNGEIVGVTYRDFLTITVGDRAFYYALAQKESTNEEEAVYYRVNPLGSLYNLLEYEYNKDITEMKSILKLNDATYIPIRQNQGISQSGQQLLAAIYGKTQQTQQSPEAVKTQNADDFAIDPTTGTGQTQIDNIDIDDIATDPSQVNDVASMALLQTMMGKTPSAPAIQPAPQVQQQSIAPTVEQKPEVTKPKTLSDWFKTTPIASILNRGSKGKPKIDNLSAEQTKELDNIKGTDDNGDPHC